MPAKHDREETMSANEINPTKCLKHSETPTLNELAEELIQNVRNLCLFAASDAKGFSRIETDERIPFLEELKGLVKKKLDNLGRNIRRRRNSATGFDGKAGRPRKKREDEREDEGESVSEQHPTSSKEIEVIDLVSKPHEIPSFEAESSSTQPPPQSSTTTISSQKL